MPIETLNFKAHAHEALADAQLQTALSRLREGFVKKRKIAFSLLADHQIWRDAAAAIRQHALDHLPEYLERYEAQVHAMGGHVHWARDDEEARTLVLQICRDSNAKTICKGKSMVSEEIKLNDALEAAGMEVTETDLGEYILQLAHETPSHIIAPAMHKSRQQIADLFSKAHHHPSPHEATALVEEARLVMREKFFHADVGITGANFLVAETGASVIVTNEGNGDLSQTLARTHIVVTGIERIVPTMNDVAVLLRMLARSATGQDQSCYTTFSAGPRRVDDVDGPSAYHVVLVDNGRARMSAGPYRAMLRCIRCGACLNHCPVYNKVGGHTYGWVYPGPMGSVLSPLMLGLDKTYDLPNACTLNGRCKEVCPVKIPLSDILRDLRSDQMKQKLPPVWQRLALWGWALLCRHPRLFGLSMRASNMALKWHIVRSLLRHSRYAQGRELPSTANHTFLGRYT